MNASRDFINYLVRAGHIDAKDVPEDVKVKVEHSNNEGNDGPPQLNNQQQQRPVFQVLLVNHILLYT